MPSYIRGMLEELNFNTIWLIIKDKNNDDSIKDYNL